VARAAYRGYRRRRREIVVPWTMIPVVKLYQLFPGVVEWGMGRIIRNSPMLGTEVLESKEK